MNRLGTLKLLFWIWVGWHLLFGLLATFAPEAGATAVGWNVAGGWSNELTTMSTQYGMVMVLLAGVFSIAAIDPLKYLNVVWIAVAEQALGIIYAGYIFPLFGQLAISQMLVQAVINSVVIALFIMLWLGLRDRSGKLSRA